MHFIKNGPSAKKSSGSECMYLVIELQLKDLGIDIKACNAQNRMPFFVKKNAKVLNKLMIRHHMKMLISVMHWK